MKTGKLVVISGPSGAGKGTIIEMLLKKHPGLIKQAVTATTRPPRPGEKDGVDHYFMSEPQFKKKVQAGEFLEHSKFDFHLYGTLRKSVKEALKTEVDEIVEVDVGGAKKIKAEFPDAALIFINAPSKKELRNRLKKRHTEGAHDLKVRLAKAHDELEQAKKDFDHIVINPTGHPEKAVAEIEKILRIED